ncbi:hypothetical protein AGMMS49944_30240 [Spirochaetia bacterium]|nr:hypothetical protein AGMMS49944_30240 [Spirochaetia bacterium]
MTIEQTIDMPVETKHLSVFERKAAEKDAAADPYKGLVLKKGPKTTHEEFAKNLAELRLLCKGSTLTVDRFLEMRHEETEREEAEYRRLFHHDGEV